MNICYRQGYEGYEVSGRAAYVYEGGGALETGITRGLERESGRAYPTVRTDRNVATPVGLYFREVTERSAIERLVEMLCDVYEGDGYGSMAPRKEDTIVYDRYDEVSTYFGVYAGCEAGGNPVACLRVVHGDRVAGTEPDPLPMLAYFPDAAAVRAACAGWREEGATFTETGRMAILPGYRGHGLVEQMVDAVAAWGFLSAGVDRALVAPQSALERIYRRVGFRKLSGTGTHVIEPVGRKTSCLITSFAAVPDGRKPVLRAMVEAMRHYGEIRLDVRA